MLHNCVPPCYTNFYVVLLYHPCFVPFLLKNGVHPFFVQFIIIYYYINYKSPPSLFLSNLFYNYYYKSPLFSNKHLEFEKKSTMPPKTTNVLNESNKIIFKKTTPSDKNKLCQKAVAINKPMDNAEIIDIKAMDEATNKAESIAVDKVKTIEENGDSISIIQSDVKPLSLPELKSTTPTDENRMRWNDHRIEGLLEFRMKMYGEAFSKNKSNSQIAEIWEKITFKFNAAYEAKATSTQLKNKFHSLKAEYGRIMCARTETGNKTESKIHTPSYWDILVVYFGDRVGLSMVEFGSNTDQAGLDPSFTEKDELSDDDESCASGFKGSTFRRKLEVEEEIRSQQSKRQRKQEKSEMVQCFELLAKSFATSSDSAPIESSSNSKFEELIQTIRDDRADRKLQTEMFKDMIEQQNIVNTALIKFLVSQNNQEKK